MEQKAGAQISKRSFVQAVVILFVLMMIAGVLTLIIPAGQYARTTLDGREVIDPASFQFVPKPNYLIWRWFTAPLVVLEHSGFGTSLSGGLRSMRASVGESTASPWRGE